MQYIVGISEIFRIVSEKDSMAMVDNIDIQVWSYNPTITPALLEERLSNQDNMPYQLLLEFVRKVEYRLVYSYQHAYPLADLQYYQAKGRRVQVNAISIE